MPRAYDEKMSQRRLEKREKGPAKVKMKAKTFQFFCYAKNQKVPRAYESLNPALGFAPLKRKNKCIFERSR
jgi:hypothetical protein